LAPCNYQGCIGQRSTSRGTAAQAMRFRHEVWAGGQVERRCPMAATGLDVFDKTLQTTNIWLDEIMEVIGPDRQVAWHTLGAVLRPLRDRLPLGLAAHLGSQLPLLVRGLYYDQWEPEKQPDKTRSLEEFLGRIGEQLENIRPVNVQEGTRAVFHVLSRHLDRGQTVKVRDALPEDIRRSLWPENFLEEGPSRQQAASERTATKPH
jgi:uncharacterized protein (DUF2267 family)